MNQNKWQMEAGRWKIALTKVNVLNYYDIIMSGFDKIDFADQPRVVAKTLETKNPSITTMTARRSRNIKFSKKLWFIPAVLVLLVAAIAFPAYATYKSGLKTYREAKLIKTAMAQQDIALASEEIAKTQKLLKETQSNFHLLLPLKFVPIVSWYYNDADHMMNAAAHGLESGAIITESLKPYADILGLKGGGTFVGGSTEERIKTAVLTMGKITPQIDKIETSLLAVDKEMQAVNPAHYPEFIFGKKVKAQLTSVRDITDQTASFIHDAKPLAKSLPSLLGESEEKKYLVLLQNDKELRATGGFITAYAVFRIDKGVIKLDKSEDIYKLDDSIPGKGKAPAPILKYLPKVYTLNLRDSNLSPDFIESMETFKSMYDRAGLKTDVDGIIAIDTNVLVSIIKILDDNVEAGGMKFNTQIDPRCECPQVIYELENNISRPVNYVKTDRKSIIGDLISAIMVKALSSSPKIYWGPLVQSFVTQSAQKHAMFYLYDEEAQKGIEGLNAAGQILPFEGDYLHINEVNFSGAKVNIFMKETVDNEYKIEKDGSIIKTVTVHYKNPFPPSDCNLERGGLCLNAEYRDWFRVYVPKGSELIDSKGSQVKITTYEDLGKTVFDGFLTVRPKGVGTLTISYKLPFKVSGNKLPLMIQKQPGTYGYAYTNIVNGKTQNSFDLLTDKEFELKVR